MASGAAPASVPPQDMWETLFEELVPLSTQLVTPALAEAFEIPTAKASVPVSQLGQLANPSASGQTKSSYQVPLYPVRPSLGGAHQPLMPNYFPQPGQTAGVQQPAVALEPQAQPMQGITPNLQGMGNPNLQQAGYNAVPVEEAGHPGYMGSGWHDQPTGANQLQPPQPSGRGQQDLGSDSPENPDELQTRALKRPRLVWTAQLHQRFVDAVKQLGLKNAVPKTIMQLMNVDGLTRENVASHLQKYRLQLRKEEGRGEGMDNNFEEEHYPEMEGY